MKNITINNEFVKKIKKEVLTKGNNCDEYYIGIIQGVKYTLEYLKHAIEEGIISESDIKAFIDDAINDVDKF